MSRRIKSLQLRLTLELAALFFVASCLAVGGLIYSASLTAGSLADRELGLRAEDLADYMALDEIAGSLKAGGSNWPGLDVKVATNVWHTLALKAEGDRFSIFYDGKTLFTAEDNTFAGRGKVALWTKADSVTHFDTIAITPLD
jgi:hypothetical protein